ncbi:DUF6261 family protein [Marinifilum flexuosum]|uniref:DUF6261 family protein n=1 Tax=Marinifilum flexuosum TaxID=1117708 RepID=UPI002494C719|nr:DUF6261 family protein [Marinifilum flexuosum]
MTLIKKISTNSRNGDISALLTLILGAFAKSDWSVDVYLTELINTIRGYCTSLTEALNRLKVYSQMAEKDNIRDMAIKSLFKLVEGYTHIPIAEINEAAKVVANVLEQYGMDIRNDDYAAETAEVNSLLNDLSKPEVVAAIAKLQGAAEIIAVLTASEKDFEAIALQQAEGEGAKKDLATASKLKKAAIKEVNDNLVGYMNTMAKVQPDTYLSATQTIAELIENNNELVKRRRTKSDEEVEAEAI